MPTLLDRLLPPPGPSRRTRPAELVYAIDETPPPAVLLGLGAQHAALSMMFIVYAVVAAQGIGLDTAATGRFVSASLFMAGLATLVQALPSRFGAGLLLVAIPAPARLPIFVAVATGYGLGAAMGATIVSALTALLLSPFVPRLRAFFPPEVIGVVVTLLGLSLVVGGLTRGAGLTAGGEVSAGAVAAAAATLATIVAVSLWGRPALRRLAVLAGVVAGTAVAAATGTLSGGLDALAALPPVAVPLLGLDLPAPTFLAVPIAIYLVTELIGVVDLFGTALSLDKMDDSRWRRVDMRLVARAVVGMGLTQVLQGLAGLLTTATSSANLGLTHASGITAWRVGAAAGLVLMAAAFIPPLAGLIALVPSPVVGGILIYTASFLIVAGIGLSTSRLMDTRRGFIVGLALVCGTGVMLLPAIAQASPDWGRIIVESGLTVGSIAAITLNAVLRIGVKRTAVLALDPADEGRQAAEFLERQGGAWGARAEVVVRAGVALGEALEALRQSGVEGPVTLAASFDETNLRCRLRHAGPPLPLEGGAALPDAAALLEMDEDAEEAAMRRVSAALVARLADRVRARERGGRSEVVFDFEH